MNINIRAVLATCLVVTGLVSPALGGFSNFGGGHHDFTTLASAWDPGVATARVGGNPAPGGATWSVMAAGVADSVLDDHGPGGPGADVTTALAALYAGGVGETVTIGLALDKWAAVSAFTNLGMVPDGGGFFGDPGAAGLVGDIRIGAIYIDGAVGANTLAHAYSPGTTASGWLSNLGGDTHFDNSNVWGDTPIAVVGTIDFHTVALHELGHALGLGHSVIVGSVMEATYAGPRRTLHADDIAGIQAIYGVPEPSTFALATLGMLGLGMFRQRRRR